MKINAELLSSLFVRRFEFFTFKIALFPLQLVILRLGFTQMFSISITSNAGVNGGRETNHPKSCQDERQDHDLLFQIKS